MVRAIATFALSSCFAVTLCTTAAGQQPRVIEFKGVPLGVSQAQLREKMPLFECWGPLICSAAWDTAADKRCGRIVPRMDKASEETTLQCRKQVLDELSYGPIVPNRFTALFLEDKLGRVRIDLDSVDFGRLRAAMVEKFGQPTSDARSTVQNRVGASFDNESVRWRIGDGEILLEQRFGSIDNSVVLITADWYARRESEKAKDQAKSSAKNL